MSLENISHTGTIEIDGFKLGYCIEGTGRPAIVIGSSIYYPRTFSQNLRKHLKFIFVDHRGFVPAPGPVDNTAFSLEKLIDDIEHIRCTLYLEQIIIIGHSGHGYLALEYAKKYPEHVSQVVIIATGPDQSEASHASAQLYFQDSICPERKSFLEKNLSHLQADIEAAPEKRFITLLLRLGALSWYNYTFDATPLWDGIYVNMQMFDYVWGIVFRDIDIIKGLNTFDKPVLLCLGIYDFLVAPFFTWNPIRTNFKKLTLRLFDKSSHTPQFEEPELFDQELLQWLSQTKSSK